MMHTQVDLVATAMATTMGITAGQVVTLTPGQGKITLTSGQGKVTLVKEKARFIKLVLRPLSCYSASATSLITGDLAIEETLVTCDKEADVCFGKVQRIFLLQK